MYYLNDLGLLCTLGADKDSVSAQVLAADRPVPDPEVLLAPEGDYRVGRVSAELPQLADQWQRYDCRNNQLALAAMRQIECSVFEAKSRYGPDRLGIVMATSTAGIDDTERAVSALAQGHQPAAGYHAIRGVLGSLGEFCAAVLGITGPAYTLSVACASSAFAALSARRLLASGLCDAVVFGGVDSLCQLTLQGFGALEAQSASVCKPFAAERDGINIGEAAAVFLLTREQSGPRLMGGAGSSDAHHISAPHPEGVGAVAAMSAALDDAGLGASDIDYINLHGTATPQNDAMESKAVYSLFGDTVPASSTKAFTGHTLGAAGALELGLCWLLLQREANWRLPPALYLNERDRELAPIQLVGERSTNSSFPRYCLSNSFAFGGSNVSLVIGRDHE